MSFHWFHVTLEGQHGEDMICARQCPSTQHQSRFELLVYILVDYVFWTEFRIQSIFWKGQHNLFTEKPSRPDDLWVGGLLRPNLRLWDSKGCFQRSQRFMGQKRLKIVAVSCCFAFLESLLHWHEFSAVLRSVCASSHWSWGTFLAAELHLWSISTLQY